MISINILLLFALFIIKHFIADFLWQSESMIKEKGTYGANGGIRHSLIHAVLTFAIVAWMVSIPMALLAGLIDFVVHYHIDWAKMNITKKLTPAHREFWIWLGADQLLHYLTYIGIIYVVVC